jgi:transportin-3
VLKKMPALLLESELLVTAFHCGCAGLHVQHREANRSVVCFFETLVGISSQHARAQVSPASAHALLALLTEHGAQLVHAMVFAIAGVLPQSRIRFIVPVLKMLVDMEPTTCRAWVSAGVQSLPADAHIDGNTLLNALFSAEALQDEKAFANAIDAFSSACRRKRIL